MLFFMLFLGSFNNVLHASNDKGSQKPALLYVSANITIAISNNIIITENFKSQNLEFSTRKKQILTNTLYIVKGTTYYIDSSNKHLQLIEINNIQNSVATNTTTQKNNTTHCTTSIAKQKAKTSFIKLPFGNNNSYYFTKSTTSVVPTTQNQNSKLKKSYLNYTRFSILFFPTIKTITSYNKNNIIASSAFCRYRFSLPPPSPLTPKGGNV